VLALLGQISPRTKEQFSLPRKIDGTMLGPLTSTCVEMLFAR